MTIKIETGDLLKQDGIDAIVNTVNCVGIMGKGIALQFKRKWPDNFKAYEGACKRGEVVPGKMHVFDSGGLIKPNFIINFPTKNHWKERSKLSYIDDGLHDLINQIERLHIRSIAIPPLGCGNGGLDWEEVRPRIEKAFQALPNVTVHLFPPGATPDAKSMETGTKKPRMTRGRAAILKLLEVYKELNYGLSKIEIQKLAYFLQISGEDLKLKFEAHHYGPYAAQLEHALQNMEGHYIRGIGDGVAMPDIEPIEGALSQAEEFLAAAEGTGLNEKIDRIDDLIAGFKTPYGLELLASVQWVATHEPFARNETEALRAVQMWNERKKTLMEADHVAAAWQRLSECQWI